MPSLADLRQRMPELAGLDDANAVAYLHDAYYPGRSLEEIAAAVGYKPPEPPPPAPSLFDRAKDLGLGLAQGVVQVPQAAVGLADIVTGGQVGKTLESGMTDAFGNNVGFKPDQAIQYLESLKSPAQQAASRAVNERRRVVKDL